MNYSGFLSIVFFSLTMMLQACNTTAQNNYKSVEEAKGLSIGDEAPDFKGMTQFDEEFQLSESLKNGPVVVIFYRGQWCPICNRHLSRIQSQLTEIYRKGASVVAISPERSDLLKQTASKTGADFNLVYDEGYRIAGAYDVLFKPDSKSVEMYNSKLDANLAQAHSDDSEQLPVPATFIIGQNGKIVWRHFDPDYKKRASAEDIIENIPVK